MSASNRPARIRTESEKRYRALLAEHAESAQSLKAFSERKEISYTSLMYWKRRIRELDEGPSVEKKRKSRSVRSRFVAIRAPSELEFHFPSGLRLSIPEGFQEDAVARLVRRLLGPC